MHQNLIENTQLRKNMGRYGRDLAQSKFDFKIIIPKIIKLYQ